MKKRKMQTIGSNYIDSANSSPYWGKSPCKRYKGVAGKGGATTNHGIPDSVFERELKAYLKGGAVHA